LRKALKNAVPGPKLGVKKKRLVVITSALFEFVAVMIPKQL